MMNDGSGQKRKRQPPGVRQRAAVVKARQNEERVPIVHAPCERRPFDPEAAIARAKEWERPWERD